MRLDKPSPRARGRGPAGWDFRPRWRLIWNREIALGPGKADLLEAIRQTGSISRAAESLGMSYRRAWLLVETMNRCFSAPVVASGRWRGKGAWLTPEGEEVLRLYRALEARSYDAARSTLNRIRALLRPEAPKRKSRAISGRRSRSR